MKKKSWIGIGLGLTLAVFAAVAFQFFQTKNSLELESKQDVSRVPAQEPSYCIALRGNGELEPAHWGALARTIEQLGLPSAMAGGSSATVSMFLMDAIAAHPMIHNQNPDLQKERASLLLKSLLGFFTELQKTKTWSDVQSLYGTYEKTKNLDFLQKVGVFINQGQFKPAIATLNKAIELGVLSAESAQPLMAAALISDKKKAQFYWQQLVETASVFGKFDAAHDDNLFFRTGIVSFEKAAVTFGKIASFYAAAGADKKQMENWQNFMNSCAPDSKGQTWLEIIKSRPRCADDFHNLFETHFANPTNSHPEDQKIGQHIRVYPTTTVLTGSAAAQFHEAVLQYHQKMDPHFGKDFHINNPEEVRFGYWGHPEKLLHIAQSLDINDEKSRRFLSLGMATWKQVLSLSPAEPGLSPLKEFTAQGQNYVSAGGWSDLHPVLVLKASGCDQVVYLTRQGGESLFAQGVAKRLLNLDRDWSKLDSSSELSQKLNDGGDPSDQASTWSKLYNLGNPSSSLVRSLSKASAVLCTNWNAFDVKKDFVPLIEDAYRSSFWINPNQNSSAVAGLNPVLQSKKPGCVP